MRRTNLVTAILAAQLTHLGCNNDDATVAVRIKPTTLDEATVGQSYDARLSLRDAYPGEIEWRIVEGALPAGLALARVDASTGAIRGTPEEAGVFGLRIGATGSKGGYDETEVQLVVRASAVTISTDELPNGSVGEPYTAAIAAEGGFAKMWSVVAGALPPGLALTTSATGDGSIDGIPTESGAFAFTVRVQSRDKSYAERALRIDVTGAPLALVTVALHPAAVGAGYSATVVASGGSEQGYRWSVSSGSLPEGLSIRSDGTPSTVVEGMPVTAGLFDFELEVTDSQDHTARRSYSIEVSPDLPPLVFPDVALPAGTVGAAYTATLAASGGSGDYSWSVVQGALPAGLTIDPTGRPETRITGTPEMGGDFVFAIRVEDSAEQMVDRTLHLSIADVEPLEITTGSLPSARRGQPYSAFVEVAGGVLPIAWTVQGLPPGLTFVVDSDRRGTISGAATASGSWPVTIAVSDAAGATAQRDLDLTVTALSILTSTLPVGLECHPYSASIFAGGGTGTFTWSASGLPDGLTLAASTGAEVRLEGEPGVTGVHALTITVADAAGSATAAIDLEVISDPQGRRWIALVGDLTADNDTGVHVAGICGTRVEPATLVSPPAGGFGDASSSATDQVRFSPDGRSIGFVGDFRLDGVNELFVASLDGSGHGPAVRVSGDQNPGGLVSDFRWSPDGTQLVYRADQIVDGQFELFFVDLSAPGISVKVNPDFPVGGNLSTDDFYWSPDGRWVAYQADGDVDGENELYLADMTSGPPFAVYPANTPLPANGDVFDDFRWLPAGDGIVFRADMLTDGVNELFLVDTAGLIPSAPVRVNGPTVSGGDVSSFAIRPDGSAISYVADEVTNDQLELFVAGLAATTPLPSTIASAPLVTGGNVVAARWSDDGTRILYTADGSVDEQFELYLIDGPDLSRVRRISGNLIADGDVRADSGFEVSPDGRWAAFIADSAQDGADALHVVELVSAAVPMVEETFADGNRTTQNPPVSLSWVTSGGSSNLTAAGGAMTLNTGGTSGRHAVAHFPPQSLPVGSTVSLDFDFSVAGPVDLTNGFRFGLFNSDGTPLVVSDGNNPQVTYTGYAAFTNLVPGGPSSTSLRKRDGATPNLLITSASAYSTMSGGGGGPADAFADGALHHATLAIERSGADEVVVSVEYSGGTLSAYQVTRTDPSAIVSVFDAVALCLSSSSGTAAAVTLTVSNVSIVFTPGLGEPVMIEPAPSAGQSVVDFRFSPDSQQLAYRADLTTPGQVEVFSASLLSGPGFGLGNVLHGVLPAGASASTLPVDLGWTRDSRSVLAVGNLATAGVVEAWTLNPTGTRASSPAQRAATVGRRRRVHGGARMSKRSLERSTLLAVTTAFWCCGCISIFDAPLHLPGPPPGGSDAGDAGITAEIDGGDEHDMGTESPNDAGDAGVEDRGIVDSGAKDAGPDSGEPAYDCPGRIIYVSPLGDDGETGESEGAALATINQALARALAGDCVRLAAGDYLQDVRTVRDGAAGAPITVFGTPDAVVRGGGQSRIFEINHDYIRLDGFTIDGLAGTNPDLVDSYRKKLIYIVGITIGDPLVGVLIENMSLRNARDECVRLRYFAQGNTVAYNHIENCGLEDFRFGGTGSNGEGVYIGTSPSQRIENPTNEVDDSSQNHIHHNVFMNMSECVDLKEGADDNLIEYNECSIAVDPNSGAINARANRNRFHANRLFGNSGAGIRLGGTAETDGTPNGVDNNITCNFINNNQEGIKFQTAPQAEVCGNEMPTNQSGGSTSTFGAAFQPEQPCTPDCEMR